MIKKRNAGFVINKYLIKYFGILVIICLCVNISFALLISEIMYDPDGADTDREWVEVFNETSGQINFAEYKFFEANVNHGINGGENFLGSSEYAVVVQDINKFKTDFPNYIGKIFTSSFSLSNTGELLSFKNKDSVVTHEINYAGYLSGSNGGKTLNFNGSVWGGGNPTPGRGSLVPSSGGGDTTSTTTSTTTTTTATTTTSSETTTSSNTIFNPSYTISRPWPVQDKIYVNAGENRKTISGVENIFEGKALGTDKKPALNASYNWSFGDGYTKEGQKVSHVYKNTGEYTVVLEVYSNGSIETDKIYVKVEAPDLKVKIVEKINDGQKEKFVELTNVSQSELQLSEMQIRTVGDTQYVFTIPKNFTLLAKRSVLFGKDLLKFDENLNYVAVEYANGKIITDSGKKDLQKILNLKIEEKNATTTSTSTVSVSVYTASEWEKVKTAGSSTNVVEVKKAAKKQSFFAAQNTQPKTTTKTTSTEEVQVKQENKNIIISKQEKYFWQEWFEKLGI